MTAVNEKKQAYLVERDSNHFHGGPYEVWDVGCGCSIYVVYRVLAMVGPETVALTYDRANHILGEKVLGRWHGNAMGGKAMRKLGYKPIEDGDEDE